ncbi:DUF3796 domain-containing protein [Streptococcus agalactiae]|uniref:DUF3796 domain-containing protein n=1 Tax=Streptococcus agalactiae TaxID=1311 RepID=UPI003C76FEBC
MKKNKWILFSLIFIIITIDFNLLFGSNHLSSRMKLFILLISSIAEFCSIFAIIKFQRSFQKLKMPLGLRTKCYSIVLFLSTSLYTIGIWNVTPATPNLIKEFILGTAIFIQLVFLIYFLTKKITEKPDERFYNNLSRSASLMFLIAIVVLIFIAIYSNIYGSLVLQSGYLYIFVSVLLLLFAVTYYYFEVRG